MTVNSVVYSYLLRFSFCFLLFQVDRRRYATYIIDLSTLGIIPGEFPVTISDFFLFFSGRLPFFPHESCLRIEMSCSP